MPTDSWLIKREIAAIRKFADAKQKQAIADFLKGFASRAFRRPVESEELTRHLDLYRSARKNGQSLESAIWLPIQALLVSPRFVC
ncbi:MAG: DUF1595 domain-containing protein [Planctomycetota bacterium]